MSSETVPARKIERAILATDDKTGLSDFARGLSELRVELWATRGTGRNLSAAGVPVRSIEDLTGVAAWFDGRVKTLHPAVFGGILAPRTPAGLGELAERRLLGFDLVVVNFYPFERHLRETPDATDREEFIDIGGVALARAAAKNHRFVTVVTDPEQYGPLLEEIRRLSGAVSPETRRRLAVRAFERCTEYDAAIVRGLAGPESAPDGFPDRLALRRDPLALRVRGEPPPARGDLPTGGPRRRGLRPDPPLCPEGGVALVHEPPRPRHGPVDRRGVLATGRGDREARDAVRRRNRPDDPRGARTGDRDRPRRAVRMRDRVEPAR